MLLDDPIAMYLDEGGKISPGFRLRNPQVIQEVPEPEIGVPDIPTIPTPDTGVVGRNRYQYQEPQDINDGEVHSIREAMQQQQQYEDPIYGSNRLSSYLNDPLGSGQFDGTFRAYDDNILDFEVGPTSFGNTEYIGA